LSKEQKGKGTQKICDSCRDDESCKTDFPMMHELAQKHGTCTWHSEALFKGRRDAPEEDGRDIDD